MFRTSVLSSDDWLRQKKNLLLDDICDDVDNKEHVFCQTDEHLGRVSGMGRETFIT